MASKKDSIDDLFHQPARLEIMAELCSSPDGKSFTELRERCGLTDGNLSRHIQALSQAGAVKVKKAFVNSKPLTTVAVSAKGREGFLEYLDTLEEILRDAAERAKGKGHGKESLLHALKAVKS